MVKNLTLFKNIETEFFIDLCWWKSDTTLVCISNNKIYLVNINDNIRMFEAILKKDTVVLDAYNSTIIYKYKNDLFQLNLDNKVTKQFSE